MDKNLVHQRQKHEACNFMKKKETLAQVFSCEFCEISKNTFFTEQILATASSKSNRGSYRSSHRRCSVGKGFLRKFAKFTGLRPATLLKKRLWHRCFPVNFVKFLRTPFFIEHLEWLLL